MALKGCKVHRDLKVLKGIRDYKDHKDLKETMEHKGPRDYKDLRALLVLAVERRVAELTLARVNLRLRLVPQSQPIA